MAIIEHIKRWSRGLKSEALMVWYISKHPNTPWHGRALAVGLVAYAFSPIDLIPDFIPVLGYLDDLVILPFGVLMILRMTPRHVIIECRGKAQAHLAARTGKPCSRPGAILAVAGWVIAPVLIAILARELFRTVK
jgi:uncharacterized membrane protein YkvA (DUF1232 family)